MVINGYLTVPKYFISFPKHIMHVKGCLYMASSNALVLPNNIIINGFISASNSMFKVLPKNTNITDSLILFGSDIEVLPDNLTINGYLDLRCCKNLQVLPKNLTVNGTLDIAGSNIKEIPKCTKANIINRVF